MCIPPCAIKELPPLLCCQEDLRRIVRRMTCPSRSAFITVYSALFCLTRSLFLLVLLVLRRIIACARLRGSGGRRRDWFCSFRSPSLTILSSKQSVPNGTKHADTISRLYITCKCWASTVAGCGAASGGTSTPRFPIGALRQAAT